VDQDRRRQPHAHAGAALTNERLTRNRVFASLPGPLCARLVAAGERASFDEGDIVLSEGDTADRVFVLESGSVRVFHASPDDGLEVVLKVFRAPAIFGEAEALSSGVYVENVQTMERCEILVLPVEALLTVLREHAPTATALLVDVAARLAITAQHEKSLAFDPITVRLANYLVDYATWTNPEGEPRPLLRLTQDDMAAAVGATRRSIGKDVTAWQKERVLAREGPHYRVLDLDALRRFADRDRPRLHYTLERRKKAR
jgi:CRP-like cAMP-binding protein